jgi:hypothetical protein
MKAKEIVDSLLQIPSLVTALREDPSSFTRLLGLGEDQSRALSGAASLVGNLLNPAKAPQPAPSSQAAQGSSASATPCAERPSGTTGNGTALVGAVGITAVAGAVAVLGVVSVVALNKTDCGE